MTADDDDPALHALNRAYEALSKLLGANHDHHDERVAYLNIARGARLVLTLLHNPNPDTLYAPTGVPAELTCIGCARLVAITAAGIAAQFITNTNADGREAYETFLYSLIAHGLDQAQPR